ncbi:MULTISPECIES: UDP-N-acetylmuramoyl-L-alanine--D-glutamate ligase [unclassified Paenibacillus]|uniref:UDP-N-acetylmuramoyl-L-alanine--D-glutamate ligase n=1 Tax=unclassified Paenibacillus TaxID=185978 RepID=UPI001AEA53DB|nr:MULTISPECIES: UDP-N-acetylmuramoyl-L-alanine--D-glutamate ligase [unclassified Paenibacillus]MBP1156279.1 UDP-N-acetylmuramoylalanine--D-glutamate ligase [Paenibacillus sp. PvP091]MBP1168335.1 UDP-N-acetylmuramoylalanine--D-glutamate ligase [Paenibacillus sp. PvR098]MBP2439363.1 UDP-N-acetylmuramoylalanine--D-glutamate ligase [Paenibacillus sp. PvP052]
MEHPQNYRGRQVVILGLARSGVAAAKLFHDKGALVTVNDKKERELCPEADELEALGISVVCGGHPTGIIHEGISLVVKNPGIPYSADPLRRAAQLGIEVVTEVEVAYHICRAPMICITGSNGKTTTTTWTGLMLEAGGLKPIVAGNIGRALTEAALEAEDDNHMVVELSSFQLKGTRTFRPRVGCLLNVYETHLDYHGTMEDYVESKTKLFANQTAEDTAVLNWDDAVCRKAAGELKSRVLPFSVRSELAHGVFVSPPFGGEGEDAEGVIVYRDNEGVLHPIVPVKELGIPGKHNVENALAASGMALVSGVPIDIIAQVLKEFRGVEHRLEYVALKEEVLFYNDSKATNPTATIKTIESFSQNIILIAGGLDRGSDYVELLTAFQKQVKGLVALGETKEKIASVARLAGMSQVKTVDTAKELQDTVAEAVRAAYAMAKPGDVVLLSPACASWDMFPSYEERGRMFKQTVHNL